MESPLSLRACIGTMNRFVLVLVLEAKPTIRGRERRRGRKSPFMESPLSFFRMHWDHEPTSNPSQEGNFRDADECLLPSWEGSGVGRFMEREPSEDETPGLTSRLSVSDSRQELIRADHFLSRRSKAGSTFVHALRSRVCVRKPGAWDRRRRGSERSTIHPRQWWPAALAR